MSVKAVLFDFDYTLVDSSDGIVACSEIAMKEMGYPSPSPDAIRSLIGKPLPGMFHILTGSDNHFDGKQFETLFMSNMPGVMTENTRLFSTVPTCLSALANQSLRLGIVSTKTTAPMIELLHREGLHDAFEVVVGGEHVLNHKPDPEGLEHALNQMVLTPNEVLYIGDSLYDAGAAMNAGTPFVAVLTGKTEPEQFREFLPSAILDDLTTLPTLMASVAGQWPIPGVNCFAVESVSESCL